MHGLIFETSVWLLAESTRLLPFSETAFQDSSEAKFDPSRPRNASPKEYEAPLKASSFPVFSFPVFEVLQKLPKLIFYIFSAASAFNSHQGQPEQNQVSAADELKSPRSYDATNQFDTAGDFERQNEPSRVWNEEFPPTTGVSLPE